MPTEAEVQATIGDLVKIIDEFRNYASVNTERFASGAASHEESFRANLQDDFSFHAEIGREVERFRSRLSQQIASGAELLVPGFREYGKIISAPETTTQRILDRLYTHFIDNTLRVTSRGFTFGSPSAAGGNVGNGVLNRLTLDENGFDLEAQTPDAKVARCISDEFSGAVKHEEVFELYGADAARDLLLVGGSGKRRLLKALSARDSLNFFSNPSFEEFTGTLATPTAITDWTITDIAAVAVSEATTYRDFQAIDTARSLQITGNNEVNQDFSLRRLSANPNTPIYVQIAVHKGTATQGVIDLTFGSTSTGTGTTSFAISGLSAGWNVFRLATELTAGGGTRNWYKNFKSSGGFIGFEVSGMGTGEHIFIDDVIVAPMSEFDGAWYALVGGTTKFLRDDGFTFSDSATESILQFWFWRLFGRYLPHATGTPVTWAEPT